MTWAEVTGKVSTPLLPIHGARRTCDSASLDGQLASSVNITRTCLTMVTACCRTAVLATVQIGCLVEKKFLQGKIAAISQTARRGSCVNWLHILHCSAADVLCAQAVYFNWSAKQKHSLQNFLTSNCKRSLATLTKQLSACCSRLPRRAFMDLRD